MIIYLLIIIILLLAYLIYKTKKIGENMCGGMDQGCCCSGNETMRAGR